MRENRIGCRHHWRQSLGGDCQPPSIWNGLLRLRPLDQFIDGCSRRKQTQNGNPTQISEGGQAQEFGYFVLLNFLWTFNLLWAMFQNRSRGSLCDSPGSTDGQQQHRVLLWACVSHVGLDQAVHVQIVGVGPPVPCENCCRGGQLLAISRAAESMSTNAKKVKE